jgi:hypothetical protein
MTPINRGCHIVFVCKWSLDGKEARLTTPGDDHLTLDSANEGALELGWSFQSDGVAVGDAVVCPACAKRGEIAAARAPG